MNMKIDKQIAEQLYDPGWNAGRTNTLWNRVVEHRRGRQNVRSHLRRTFDPPKSWLTAMTKGIRKRSDVRNPASTVVSVWRRLSPSKQIEIKRKDAAGEKFAYDLPLPEDHATKGSGTVRIVKPFRLAEVQANVSHSAFARMERSGMFEKMKRTDGSTALVKRCKSKSGNCNIFVDRM